MKDNNSFDEELYNQLPEQKNVSRNTVNLPKNNTAPIIQTLGDPFKLMRINLLDPTEAERLNKEEKNLKLTEKLKKQI